MARHFAWVLAAVLLGTPVLANGPQEESRRDRDGRESRQDSNRWKWWINPEHRKELGITDAQSKQIDQIFESSFPPQRAKYREAEQLESELSQMLKESTADVSTVAAKVEQLEKTQAERRAMRTVMLYRMNLVLSPEQRVKLEDFWKKREENRRRRP
jgi:Spy/CpxP family protein refolding chaperone